MILVFLRCLFDTNTLINLVKSPKMAENLKKEFELSDSQIIVTSQTRKEIQKLGMNYDSMVKSVSEILGSKIYDLELNSEIKSNSKFLNGLLKPLHCGDDAILSAAVTTKSTLFTADRALAKCAKKIGCQVKMIQEDWYN